MKLEQVIGITAELSSLERSLREQAIHFYQLANEHMFRNLETNVFNCRHVILELVRMAKNADPAFSNELKDVIEALEKQLNDMERSAGEIVLLRAVELSGSRIYEAKLAEEREGFLRYFNELYKNMQKAKSLLLAYGNSVEKIREFWEEYVHNKTFWLYHGTSILFLEIIREHGLDPSAIPAGIKRAIEIISRIYGKRGIRAGDIVTDITKKPIFLAYSRNVSKAADILSAGGVKLPAFLYELLNEENLPMTKEQLLSELPTEEKFIVKAIWRFGRILRVRNKMVVLLISVNSNFLKYYGIPDFINSYDEFQKYVVDPCINANRERWGIVLGQGFYEWIYFAVVTSRNNFINVSSHFEIIVRTRIPPQFIYLEVQGLAGPELLHISGLNEEVIPRLLAT